MSIADYIQNDLGSRLASGSDLPAQLTLEALSQHYEVSYTPVRKAIGALTEGGLLRKKPNGRLEPVAPARLSQQAKSAPGTRASTATIGPHDPLPVITHDLVELSLEGQPVYLREEATAAKYGLSRAVIRSMFLRLAGEGLLDHVPRRGWQVRPFRQEDLQAFIDVREVLELKALELARPKLRSESAKADLQRMFDGNREPKRQQDPIAIDNSLHRYLVETADNRYITDFFARHGSFYDILFHWEALDRPAAIEAAEQHRDILSALLAEDWRRAHKALSHHIRGNHPVLSELHR